MTKVTILKEQWVLDTFERESGKLFLVAVADRTKNTLIDVIKKWIKAETFILINGLHDIGKSG